MSLSLTIVPLAPTVDMVGEPDVHSAYSLAGHIVLSLKSAASSFFDGRSRPTRLLLTSLELTFEGKSEYISGSAGYNAARLFTVSKQLLPTSKGTPNTPQPIELSNEGLEDGATWQVVFDLPIPGWLPASTIFGDEDLSGVGYALFARATYMPLEDDAVGSSPSLGTPSVWKPWKWAAMCASTFRLRAKATSAKPTPIYVNRHAALPPSSTSFPDALYSVFMIAPERATADVAAIPPAILSGIQVMASLPSSISIHDASLPMTMRIRSKNDDDITGRLRVVSFLVDVEQQESYQCAVSHAYATMNPLPQESQQPPNKPLMDPHPMETLFTLGLLCTSDFNEPRSTSRNWSIVRPDQSLSFRLNESAPGDQSEPIAYAVQSTSAQTEGSVPLPTTGVCLQTEGWHKISVDMPIVSAPQSSSSALTFFDDDEELTAGGNLHLASRRLPDVAGAKPSLPESKAKGPRRHLRPSFESPFFRVRHEIRVSVTCAYKPEGPDSVEVRSDLKFTVPANFVCLSPSVETFDDRCLSPVPSEASLVSDSMLSSPASSLSSLPPTPTRSLSRASSRADAASLSPSALQLSLQPTLSTPYLTAPSAYPRTHPLGSNALPAYSQLYHANGDWRDDIFAGLPAYSKAPEDALVSAALSGESNGLAV